MVDQSTPFFHLLVGKCPYSSLIIHFQIGDISLSCGEKGEKVGKSRNLELILTPSHKFSLGSPQNFKTSSDTPFGPIARNSLDYAPTLMG